MLLIRIAAFYLGCHLLRFAMQDERIDKSTREQLEMTL